MTEEERLQLEKEVEALEVQKSKESGFEEQMEIADKIHNIKMKLNGVRPSDSFVECIGCGS